MIVEIIKHTPIWVFVLFFGLIYLGYTQTKDRKVHLLRIFILPFVMVLLSMFSIISAFGMTKTVLVIWIIGVIISFIIGLKLAFPKNIRYDNSEKVFHVPGSWIPMFLIFVIFTVKYSVGVIVAKHLPIVKESDFIMIVSLLYGFLSGMFLSRSIVILQSKFEISSKVKQ